MCHTVDSHKTTARLSSMDSSRNVISEILLRVYWLLPGDVLVQQTILVGDGGSRRKLLPRHVFGRIHHVLHRLAGDRTIEVKGDRCRQLVLVVNDSQRSADRRHVELEVAPLPAAVKAAGECSEDPVGMTLRRGGHYREGEQAKHNGRAEPHDSSLQMLWARD